MDKDLDDGFGATAQKRERSEHVQLLTSEPARLSLAFLTPFPGAQASTAAAPYNAGREPLSFSGPIKRPTELQGGGTATPPALPHSSGRLFSLCQPFAAPRGMCCGAQDCLLTLKFPEPEKCCLIELPSTHSQGGTGLGKRVKNLALE